MQVGPRLSWLDPNAVSSDPSSAGVDLSHHATATANFSRTPMNFPNGDGLVLPKRGTRHEGPAAAVGDPWEAVPEADAAVEQGQQVGEPIELLRRLSLEDPLERRPECHAGRQEQQRIREQFIDRKAGKTRKKEIISVLAWLAYTGDRKRARAKTLPAMANKSEEKHSATQSTKQFRALES